MQRREQAGVLPHPKGLLLGFLQMAKGIEVHSEKPQPPEALSKRIVAVA